MPCRPFNLFSSNYIGGHLLEKTGPGKQVSNRSWSFLAKWIPSWGLWPSAYMTQRWSTMILGQINYLKWWAQITRQCNGQINWISHQYHQCPPVPLPHSGCFEEKDRRCPSRGHLRCWATLPTTECSWKETWLRDSYDFQFYFSTSWSLVMISK